MNNPSTPSHASFPLPPPIGQAGSTSGAGVTPVPVDYELDRAEAVYLLALLTGSESLPKLTNEHLVRLLRQTLKLAASIGENCREWLELAAIVHGDMHPYAAEKLNIPTALGALHAAVGIPRVDVSECCNTCAFRVGSQANQTVATASDIFGCLEDRKPFLCHDVEDGEEPRRMCRGFALAVKAKEVL